MPCYTLDDVGPTLGPESWVAPSADLIGDVRLETRASVWFGAVIRADNTPILIGRESNIQDGAVCHSDPHAPLTVGARVTVGHQAILHGCTVGAGALIGMGARVLNGAVIGERCIVGAGALVPEGKVYEAGHLLIGAPARIVRALSDAELRILEASALHYAEKAALYDRSLRLQG
ncbi:gamma carbonic anhydrase family protein [Sphingomonas kaistensis]|uniref:Gamma carbonic anhydrase family protein n=1 Tax=Sphingomonas kaistensis TaxID=298708 RepID=A0ABZ2G0C8_9SPHN